MSNHDELKPLSYVEGDSVICTERVAVQYEVRQEARLFVDLLETFGPDGSSLVRPLILEVKNLRLKIAALESRLKAAGAQDVQAAIDAALESVAQKIQSAIRVLSSTTVAEAASKGGMCDAVKIILDSLGANPLADLQAQLSKANARMALLMKEKQDTIKMITTLTAKLAEARKDADRYRWLRNKANPDDGHPYITIHRQNDWGNWWNSYESALDADNAIDAAMKEPDNG